MIWYQNFRWAFRRHLSTEEGIHSIALESNRLTRAMPYVLRAAVYTGNGQSGVSRCLKIEENHELSIILKN